MEKNQTTLERLVGQKQAKKDIEGDEGDPYPGNTKNRGFDFISRPTNYYGEKNNSCVVVRSISDSQEVMTAVMGTSCMNTGKFRALTFGSKYYLR